MPAAHLNWHPKAFTFALTDSAPTLFLHIDEDAHKHHIVSQRHQSLPEMPFLPIFSASLGLSEFQTNRSKSNESQVSYPYCEKNIAQTMNAAQLPHKTIN